MRGNREEKVMLAGLGGQGVVSLGKVLAEAALEDGKFVTCLPSYGAEMRGGFSYCNVVISDKEIGSPSIERPNSCIALSRSAFLRFKDAMEEGGTIFVNASVVPEMAVREDISVYRVPANDIAGRLGVPQAANVVMLGALLARIPLVGTSSVVHQIEAIFGSKKPHLVQVNVDALEQGGAALADGFSVAQRR